MDNTEITKRILFSGRVQGVGFRWTTQQIASGFPVTGFVRNLRDGRVELVAQGTVEDIKQFVSELQKKLADNIDAVTDDVLTNSPKMSQFEIRRSGG